MFGHPRGLYVLFMTEMWERMSFYGMKALLILYMVNYLLWKQEDASHVMALYAGLVYVTPILGGILADKVFGARWAVVIGAVLIAIGHFLLAFEPLPFFYSGLGFLIAGVGFLKPNISTQVGSLYTADDHRRDAAFTIFYMGINLGAFIGPLICETLRVKYGFHYGFGAAGVGMTLGLIIYIAGMGSVERRTKEIAALGTRKAEESSETRVNHVSPEVVRDRIAVLVVICLFAIVFWMAFEQAANVMNLWADKHTNLYVFQANPPEMPVFEGDMVAADEASPDALEPDGFKLGPAYTQAINPMFIILLAPVFAWMWMWLDRKGKQPSTPVKMTIAMFGMALAYCVILLCARTENISTSASLDELPSAIKIDAKNRLFTVDEKGKQELYGATRLTWDPNNHVLRMRGVLTDLDYLRLLGETSPPAWREAVENLEKSIKERKSGIGGGAEGWSVECPIPEGVQLQPVAPLPDKLHWNADARSLAAGDDMAEVTKLQLLAAGADPAFRKAVDSVFRASSLAKVSIAWLIFFYLTCTMAELCLSPVGLSLVTKMAPPKYVGLFMGLWFLTTGGAANYLAHFIGGYWGKMTPTQYFLIFGAVALVTGLVMVTVVKALKRRMHGIQ
ncbi:MAG: peptide MFS transporter [Phycisphaerae bacterium]|nr:peptide MFS transporter [Phycisphaerae bacterium]